MQLTSRVAAALVLAVVGTQVRAACGLNEVVVELTRARYHNGCTTSECWVLKGAGVVHQRCAEPVVVKVRVTAYDKNGLPVVTREGAPFGVRPVATGAHPFSLDLWLDYDPAVTGFGADVVEVRKPYR